jgi:hypothetical protein
VVDVSGRQRRGPGVCDGDRHLRRTHNGGFEDAWVAKIGDASQTSTPTSKAASKTNTKAQGNPAQKAPSRG